MKMGMNLNIMLIDDNKIDLFVSQKVIEIINADCNIRTFISANSAINYLKIFDSNKCYETMIIPDLILLDINMPEMNGFEFLNEFKKLKNSACEDIKIYMLSSSTNMNDIKKAKKEIPSVGFINKPLTIANFEKIEMEFRPYLERFDSKAEDVDLKSIKSVSY